jgi:8-oxo-dGTP diphosphatase
MEIESKLTNRSGQELKVMYYEGLNPNENLEGKILQAVHGLCFYEDKLVIVYAKEKGYWTFPGGGIEPGETYEEALIREVKEESNMKVLHQGLIGYQDIYELDKTVRQTRSFCIVEPIGEFVGDPDGDITEIKLIDPSDIKQYFDWSEIGERIIERALELNVENLNKSQSC